MYKFLSIITLMVAASTGVLASAPLSNDATEPQISLSLSNQGLSVLDPQVCEMRDLLSLNLSGNKLTVLPEGLVHLTNLKFLSLENNLLLTWWNTLFPFLYEAQAQGVVKRLHAAQRAQGIAPAHVSWYASLPASTRLDPGTDVGLGNH